MGLLDKRANKIKTSHVVNLMFTALGGAGKAL